MSSPAVRQAELLAELFAKAQDELGASSVAVIGCAGGNGFDRIDPRKVTRVVGVDINPDYLTMAAARYAGRFADLEFCCADVAAAPLPMQPVGLIYAALVLEYVEVPAALRNLSLACLPGGHLVTVLQLPADDMAAVTPSEFTSLRALGTALRCVDPMILAQRAGGAGFTLRRHFQVASAAGKAFAVHFFQRS